MQVAVSRKSGLNLDFQSFASKLFFVSDNMNEKNKAECFHNEALMTGKILLKKVVNFLLSFLRLMRNMKI